MPQEPFLNEDWEYLPALYPCSELTRQAVADVLCVNQYTSAQVKSAEKILRDAMAYLGAETYTVSTFDELTESWQFSYGTQGWPETEKKRSCSLAAHALLSSREALVVLDTEMVGLPEILQPKQLLTCSRIGDFRRILWFLMDPRFALSLRLLCWRHPVKWLPF